MANEFEMNTNQNFQFEEITKKDIQTASENIALAGTISLEQLEENKRVFDMNEAGIEESVKKQNSLSNTKKEYKNIASILSSEKTNFSEETVAKLETRQGRNLSHILLNSTKMFGDSNEMRDVKQAVKEVEAALVTTRDASVPMSLEEITLLESRYVSAIDYCQHYISVKTTHTGSARYELVLAKMNQLMEELGLIVAMKELAGEAEFEDYLKTDCPYGILIASKVLKISGKQLIKKETSTDDNDVMQELEEEQDRAIVFSKEELDAMDQPASKIAKLLTLMSKPQEIVSKAGSDDYDLTIYMLNMLKNFPEGAHAEYFNSATVGYKGSDYKRTYKDAKGNKVVAGTLIGLIQGKDGKLTLRVGDVEKEIPYSREAIIASTTINILDNEKIFGQKCVNSTMSWLGDEDDTTNVVVVRNTALKIIKNRLGITPTQFNNISTENVRKIAVNVMKGEYTPEEIETLLLRLEAATNATEQMINGQETLELLHFREENIASLKQKVQIAPQQKKEKTKDAKEWTRDEEEAKLLLADLVYSKDTWESDENIEKSGIRMQKAVADHSYAFFLLLKDKELASGLINKMPVPQDSKEEMIAKFDKLRAAAIKDKELGVALLGKANKAVISLAVKVFIQMPEAVAAFADMEKQIDEMVEKNSIAIQEEIAQKVDELFAPPQQVEENENDLDFEDIGLYLDKKSLTAETRKAVNAQGNKELERILTESMSGDSGQGKFIKLVLKNYFASVSTLDKRSMFASVLRDAIPAQGNDEQAMRTAAGTYLGAIFKGAGPLLQKMLQGMPLEGIPMELRSAFDAVKSNLLPIPQEIVEAQLLSMVERSNGAVTKIEVSKALGAASVGQAFLCKIYGPSLSKEGKEVVVKLLRPDVRNRMMREKELMIRCAQETNEGMRKTYEGQLERIEEELDLTIEARNVELGQIYNKSRNPETETDSVSSMKLNSLIMPTTNSMVIEKSPGTTVDKYITSLKEDLRKDLDAVIVRDDQGEAVLGEKEEYQIQINEQNFAQAGQIRAKLSQKLASAQKRQEHLIILAEKWIQEGLFGEGFYHGDLHAGNIMIDDDCATVIDFGNATQLDEEQKEHVTRMMSAAYVGDYKLFCEGYHALMHKDEATETHFKSQKAEFEKMMREVLNMGSGDSAGQRIGVALIKAQELGLELPASIFNFSQCQLRLQNTIEDLNKQIVKMQKMMEHFDEQLEIEEVEMDPLLALQKTIAHSPHLAKELVIATKMSLYTGGKEEFKSAAVDLSDEGIAVFENDILDQAFKESPYTALMEAVNQYYDEKRGNPDTDITEKLSADPRFKRYSKNNKKADKLVELINSTADNKAEIVEYLKEYKESFEVYETYEQLRGIQRGESQLSQEDKEKTTTKLVDKLYTQWSNCKKVKWAEIIEKDTDNVMDSISQAITMNLNVVKHSMISEQMLRNLINKYTGDEKYGEQLKVIGARVIELKQLSANPESTGKEWLARVKAANAEFGDIIGKIMLSRVAQLSGIEVPSGEMEQFYTGEPRNFMNVMSSVLSDNVAKMIKRLGVWGMSHANEFTNGEQE